MKELQSILEDDEPNQNSPEANHIKEFLTPRG